MKTKVLIILIIGILGVNLFAQAPEWQWAIQAGGTDLDFGTSLIIDNSGDCFVTGGFQSTVNFGSISLSAAGTSEIFVARVDTDGNWIWASQAGGNFLDQSLDITLDNLGNCFITGSFENTASFGSHTITCNGGWDTFVAKIDADGIWQWAIQAGGSGYDYGFGIAVDDDGNIAVTGRFQETANFGSNTVTSNGYEDIFVAKIDANGNWLWATQAGGSDDDNGYEITLDDNGNCYIIGYFCGTATFGSNILTSNGSYDIFVAKIDADGNWQWATQAGGSVSDEGWGIAIDDNGNSYVTGYYRETASFGSYTLSSNGESDIFIAKIDTDGNWLWATQAGGNGLEFGSDISLDTTGNCYVTGKFQETASFGSYSLSSNGESDIVVAKIDTDGNWQWATQAGGASPDSGNGITVDDTGYCYVTGTFSETATFNSHSISSYGNLDIFVAKLGNNTIVENEIIPTNMELSNYPNPFNPTTIIKYSIQEKSEIELSVFNMKGQKIKTLANNEFNKGNHSVIWNGDDESGKLVSSGVYLYKLNVNGKTETMKKCLLLK